MLSWFVSALCPEFCVLCGKEGKTWCEICRSGWSFSPRRVRWVRGPVSEFFSLGPYTDPVLKGLLKRWKFGHRRAAAQALLELVKISARDYAGAFVGIEAVTFVPLHIRRFRSRGFDQSRMIAQTLAAGLHLPCGSFLRRPRSTKPQARHSDRAARRILGQRAIFSLARGMPAPVPRQVLLVDDVWTTGTTMRAAARVLRRAGVLEVMGWTLARG